MGNLRKVAVGSVILLCAGSALVAPSASGVALEVTPVSTAASSVAGAGLVSGLPISVLPAGGAASVADDAPEKSGLQTLDDDYHRLYPQLSSAEISERRKSLESGARLTEHFASYPGYAGAQIDMGSGAYVVAATNRATLDAMAAFASSLGLDLRPMLAQFTYHQLESGFNLAGSQVRGIKGADVTMDVIHNRFLVTFPSSAADKSSLVANIPGAKVAFSDKAPISLVPYDGSCTSRTSCGYTVGRFSMGRPRIKS